MLQPRLIRQNECLHRYYCLDIGLGKPIGLQAQDEDVAAQIGPAKNQARCKPTVNFQIATTYLVSTGFGFTTRTPRHALTSLIDTKQGENKTPLARPAAKPVPPPRSALPPRSQPSS